MFEIALFEPEKPPNTGNIMRLCANTGARLHLIEPLGFDLDDKQLRRAGLDYREYAQVTTHKSIKEMIERLNPGRVLAVTTKGGMTFSDVRYQGLPSQSSCIEVLKPVTLPSVNPPRAERAYAKSAM